MKKMIEKIKRFFKNLARRAEVGMIAAAAADHDNKVKRVLTWAICAVAGDKGDDMKAVLEFAVKAHDEAVTDESKKDTFETLTAIVRDVLELSIKSRRMGYELKEATTKCYRVDIFGNVKEEELYGDSECNKLANGSIVTAYIDHMGKAKPTYIINGQRFMHAAASDSGKKGKNVGKKRIGTAIYFEEKFYKAHKCLCRDVAVEFVVPDGDTIEAVFARIELADAMFENACKENKAAQDALSKCYSNLIAPSEEQIKAANDSQTAMDAAKIMLETEKAKLKYTINSSAPKHVAAKNKGNYVMTPSDEFEFELKETDHVVAQEDYYEDVPRVYTMKKDGTLEPSKYHYTGLDGISSIPVGKMSKESIDKIGYFGQFRFSTSAKGCCKFVEDITLKEAIKRFKKARLGVMLSEDGSHWIRIWPDEPIYILQVDGTKKIFHVGEDAIFNESTWKSKNLDKGDPSVWLLRHEHLRIMRCEAKIGTVRLSRQALQVLTQMTPSEAKEVARITCGKLALLSNPQFAIEQVIKQIPVFKHPALRYMATCPASQRQLNKYAFNLWLHSQEGAVEVEGAELVAQPDAKYEYDNARGIKRKKAGDLKPGEIRLPKSCGRKIGEWIWLIRYPLINPRPVLRKVAGYCPEGTIEVSMQIGETIMQDLCMDFDGDHIYAVWNKACVRAAIRTRDWIDSFMPFSTISADDLPVTESIKHIPQWEYNNRILSLGDIGKETQPVFAMQCMLHFGMMPGEVVKFPNGQTATVKEIMTYIFMKNVIVTWEADAAKRGESSHFNETPIGKKIALLTAKCVADSQPYARPRECTWFKLPVTEDKLKGKFIIDPDEGFANPVTMVRREIILTLKGIGLPEDSDEDAYEPYRSYNDVMYGSYRADNTLIGGWVFRLNEAWEAIWDKVEEDEVDLDYRWGMNCFDDSEIFIEEPKGDKLWHIGKDTEVTGDELRKLLNEGCAKALNFAPGWTSYMGDDGKPHPTREDGLTISLFVARKERSMAFANAQEEDDCGRHKKVIREDAYESARKLIKAWAWEHGYGDISDKQADEKLFMELGYALIGNRIESTNMGASLQDWANTFSDETLVEDSVTKEKYSRNFLEANADRWLMKHFRGFSDEGKRSSKRSIIERKATDIQFIHWMNAFDENDVYHYRDEDVDHVKPRMDAGEELSNFDDLQELDVPDNIAEADLPFTE